MVNQKEISLKLSKPALRALLNANISSLEDLTQYTEKEIAGLHGIGKNTMIAFKKALEESNLSFTKQESKTLLNHIRK